MKKRNLVSLILVLLIVNCFVISACAAHVTDDARLFSDQERAYLEQRAAEISEKYNFGVYIVTLDNYLNYHGSSNIEKFTMNYYDENGFGYGDDKAGTTLLLSMAERDYDLDFNSDRANEIFTYSGREQMKSRFLAYFRQNDFYGGFDEYLSTCEEYLQAAADGTPVGASDGVPDGYWDNYTDYDNERLPLWIALIPGAIAAILAVYLQASPCIRPKRNGTQMSTAYRAVWTSVGGQICSCIALLPARPGKQNPPALAAIPTIIPPAVIPAAAENSKKPQQRGQALA